MKSCRELATLLVSLGKATDRITDARFQVAEEIPCVYPDGDPLDCLLWDLDSICYAADALRKARRHLARATEALRRLEADDV